MKLCVLAAVTAFALSSPAFAQTGTSDGLNGATLGKSMPGANSGVPYPGPAATPVGSSRDAKQHAAHRKHRKHSRM
jgi:hypothetical protein